LHRGGQPSFALAEAVDQSPALERRIEDDTQRAVVERLQHVTVRRDRRRARDGRLVGVGREEDDRDLRGLL
jgi:hypothetical protein